MRFKFNPQANLKILWIATQNSIKRIPDNTVHFVRLLHYEQVFVICASFWVFSANWGWDVRQNCPHMVALRQPEQHLLEEIFFGKHGVLCHRESAEHFGTLTTFSFLQIFLSFFNWSVNSLLFDPSQGVGHSQALRGLQSLNCCLDSAISNMYSTFNS